MNKSKIVAGFLALFLGFLGAHKFYHRSWGWGLLYVITLSFLVLSTGIYSWKYFQLVSKQFRLTDEVIKDTKHYVRTHFGSNEKEILECYLSDFYGGYALESENYGSLYAYYSGNKPKPANITFAELGRFEDILDNLAATGARQSSSYEKWQQCREDVEATGQLVPFFGFFALMLGITLAIIGIIEAFCYWFMSKAHYDMKYNETPPQVFKW